MRFALLLALGFCFQANHAEAQSTAQLLPGNLTGANSVRCDDVPEAPMELRTEDCEQLTILDFSEQRPGIFDNCPSTYRIVRVWFLEDCDGTRFRHRQVINVRDRERPTFDQELPPSFRGRNSISCIDDIPEAAVLTATDNCDGEIEVYFEEDIRGQADDCSSNYSIVRKWIARDCSNNKVEHIQRIDVRDRERPVFAGPLPSNQTLDCSMVPEAPTLVAFDNCDDEVPVFFEEFTNGRTDDCPNEYTLVRTWTAIDCAGNRRRHRQRIRVRDMFGPSFVEELPTNLTVGCNDVPDPAMMSALDNCGGPVEVDFSESIQGVRGECPAEYVILRTWIATDCAGNGTLHQQRIEVISEGEFVFDGLPVAEVEANCDALPEVADVTASDVCGDREVSFEEIVEGDDCASSYTLLRIWSATDCDGNLISFTQTITVIDAFAPTFVEDLPGDLTVTCAGEVPMAVTLTATDNCDESVEVSFTESLEEDTDGCESTLKITRTWTATDWGLAGNAARHIQMIEVVDLYH